MTMRNVEALLDWCQKTCVDVTAQYFVPIGLIRGGVSVAETVRNFNTANTDFALRVDDEGYLICTKCLR